MDISSDPADNLALFIVAHHRSKSQVKRRPALSAKFVFADHIRCLATKQSLLRRQDCLRHHKMNRIATILGLAPLSMPSNQHHSASFENLQEANEGKMSILESSELSYPVTAKQALAADFKEVFPKDQETLELNNIREGPNDTSSEHIPYSHVHYIPNTEEVTLPLKILPPLQPETLQSQVHSEQNDVDSQLESGLNKDDLRLESGFDKDGKGHNRTNDLIERD